MNPVAPDASLSWLPPAVANDDGPHRGGARRCHDLPRSGLGAAREVGGVLRNARRSAAPASALEKQRNRWLGRVADAAHLWPARRLIATAAGSRCHDACSAATECLDERSGEALISPEHSPAQVLPKNFLRPCLLLLLREHPAHGYDLLERLRPLGFNRDDPGRLYRALRTLETDELVRSIWEKSTSGPDRRMYELTREGMEALHDSVTALRLTHELLGVFLSRYSEFVAVKPVTPRSPRD